MILLGMFVAATAVVLTLLLNWFLNLSKYDSLRTIPGPKPLPIIGNALEFGTTPVALWQSFVKLQNKYGSIYKLWAGTRLHLVLSKPEYLELLLTSNVHLRKSDGYDLMRPWLGDGILTSTGQKWRSRRKMITPTFHFKILENFMPVFNKQFDIMLNILKDKVKNNEGRSIDIEEIITLASLDIICETAFGIPMRAQSKGNPEFVQAVSAFMGIVSVRFLSPWLRNPIIFRTSSHYAKQQKYLKTLHDLTDKVIYDRKVEWKTKKESIERVSNDGIKKKSALLDTLLDATFNGEQLSNEDLREEVNTFMFVGHDAVSSGMCFTLYALSKNEAVQQKVYNEIVDVIGTDSKSKITISQINDLKYLDMVVKEVLRYYPTVPFIERVVENDWAIDGIKIPKNTNISVFIYGMNQQPEVFPEPEKFDPERFLPGKQSSRHCYSYIPFSAGPRNCLGQRFALLELKTCVIKCLLQFKLIPDLDFEPEIGIYTVLRSANGIKMKLSPRNKN